MSISRAGWACPRGARRGSSGRRGGGAGWACAGYRRWLAGSGACLLGCWTWFFSQWLPGQGTFFSFLFQNVAAQWWLFRLSSGSPEIPNSRDALILKVRNSSTKESQVFEYSTMTKRSWVPYSVFRGCELAVLQPTTPRYLLFAPCRSGPDGITSSWRNATGRDSSGAPYWLGLTHHASVGSHVKSIILVC